jgi:hypothetical protein
MSYSTKKVVGIWLDHIDAILIYTEDKSNRGEYAIREKIHNQHLSFHGGDEHTQNEKTMNERHKYHEELCHHITSFDAILLFGHGNAQEQLRNFLNEHKSFQDKEIIVKSGDRLTENEKIAFVRDTFNA